MPSASPAVRPWLYIRTAWESAGEGRFGERMGVLGEENRAIGAIGRTVLADRLRDRQDVAFVERAIERGAAMPGGTEAHGRIGREAVVGGDQTGDVHQHGGRRALAGKRIEGHHTKVRALPPFAQSC